MAARTTKTTTRHRLLVLLLVAVHLEAADWHWRPHIAAGGDGRSYATAWKNTKDIDWSRIKPGDRLCLHGKNDIYPDSYQPLHVRQDGVTVSGKCGEGYLDRRIVGRDKGAG